ncbi:amino acid ABC transporter permease [Microbaculum marinum]|uniref:Glutamate/aspartate import permease protein GltK n=1 Tax=Microbaculum marinum TaxID=1764581 RepID=A0AAW9S5J2_9HYPH
MTVTISELWEQRPVRWLLLALLSIAFFYYVDLRGSALGELLRPAIGEPADSGLHGRFACALVATVLLLLNFIAIRLLPRNYQVLVVWLELLVLFLAFFYSFDLSFEFIGRKIGFLISQGAVTTIYISLISIAIASVIALVAALSKMSQNPFLYGISTFYISFFRGLPLLMQIYLIYIGLPALGFVIDPVPAGITALSVCYGAYMAEIFRAGIQGVSKGQAEAAYALGLKPWQTMRKIVLPQAMRLIVPPTGNQFIAMLKDSSLVSVVGVWELTFLARTQGRSEFKHLEMLITASLIYWILSIFFELLQARLEAYYGRGDRR